MGRSQAEALKKAAQNSFARSLSNRTLQMQVRMLVERLNLALTQIAELEKVIETYLTEQQKLLQTIPDIGKVWAPTILAEIMPIFNPERRDGGSAFIAQAGLDPKMNQSGCKEGKARMSKRGSKYLRTALMEAATVAVNCAKEPMFRAIYEKQMEKNKPHLVAVSHVANKMCHVINAVLKNQKPYKPILAL
jgi:transposase